MVFFVRIVSVITAIALSTSAVAADRLSEASGQSSQAASFGTALVVAGSLTIVKASGYLVVQTAQKTGDSVVVVAKASGDAASVTLKLSGNLIKEAAITSGTIIEVSVVASGYLLVVSGEALAFIPNEAGQALLHHRRVQ